MAYAPIAAALCTMVCGALPGCQSNSDSHRNTGAPIALGSNNEPEPKEPPEPKDIADQFRARLANTRALTVESKQRISTVKRTLASTTIETSERDAEAAMAGKDDVTRVNVRINAEMTKNSFHIKMWKEGLEQIATELSLARVDGVPTMTERHWYPVLNDYRTATYPSERPDGIGDLAIQSCIFSDMPTKVCATAEFFGNWLGESWQSDIFQQNISQAEFVREELYNEKPAYCFKKIAYQGESDTGYQSRVDWYWVCPERHLLLAWRYDLVSVRPGLYAAYLIRQGDYEYRRVSEGEGNGEGAIPTPSTNPLERNEPMKKAILAFSVPRCCLCLVERSTCNPTFVICCPAGCCSRCLIPNSI